jgi:hypothetical protein
MMAVDHGNMGMIIHHGFMMLPKICPKCGHSEAEYGVIAENVAEMANGSVHI